MKALVQRVSEASVTVNAAREPSVTAIGTGLMILLGVGKGDTSEDARRLAAKTARLRIFEDESGKMNRSLLDIGGAALVVSQFTLCADTRRGLRPSFEPAALPQEAEPLYELFVQELKAAGIQVRTGSFGARMQVRLTNDGPVTIMLDSRSRAPNSSNGGI